VKGENRVNSSPPVRRRSNPDKTELRKVIRLLRSEKSSIAAGIMKKDNPVVFVATAIPNKSPILQRRGNRGFS
jgi:hypothetical protein